MEDRRATDGCTLVPDIARHCCELHDLRYRGIMRDVETREEADRLFRECIRDVGRGDGWLWRLLLWEPIAWTYWLGVRAFGWLWWRRGAAALALVVVLGGCAQQIAALGAFGAAAAESRRQFNDMKARAIMAATCDISLGAYFRELTEAERRFAALVCGGELQDAPR